MRLNSIKKLKSLEITLINKCYLRSKRSYFFNKTNSKN